MASRGFESEAPVDRLRMSVRNVLKLEKNRSFQEVKHSIVFGDDDKAIAEGILELGNALQSFDGDTLSSEFKRASTLVPHLLSRCARMNTTDDKQQSRQRQLMLDLTNLRTEFESRIRKFKRTTFLPAIPTSSPNRKTPENPKELEELSSSESETGEPGCSYSQKLLTYTHIIVDTQKLYTKVVTTHLQNKPKVH
ncbi:hypothetical protein RN001_014351 [Aquatica leii]|uniref:Uncharacterized protein n=1 Tax=Aquatica leii TaxID=1421715 RepID=A0AAN7NXQ8_9COLE|nr:hypothetical protein RN001_014351 [Aquatica leii]